ncbi:MAG: Uncharacterized protein XD42_0070 [Thermodesulfobacterium sp. 37_54]|jgi:hypothetical protein|uniref:SAM-dependent chlorinase/fluorinase n=1 Tax=Thermodesulfobacterium commune TaxID=1741 RepID=A0A101FKH9_9BACT|nr:MAG: Uncharacterized protein XD42_0070 [Thermodesulfobacterium sp. 37_54]KUK19892.1 MAG: Uncharacterized protein XD55_0067 [Thermodesulfobacterium commune]MDK2862289.1 hypothetical protein [Thermodesulfobacterium sp.]KUK38690.1 MAG: Uncharacterized protein XD67_0058 [Thermodesulfobacterium commune]HAA84576.1 hypothetical protein [Thermodesulfobacterium commune]
MYKTVVLLTDFGIEDHYVGVVKGKILQELDKKGVNLTSLQFIDLCHQVSPQDVRRAALTLFFSYRYFPEGTIFLCVVDPGVGTERKALVVKTDKYFFVGPNNGIFSLIYQTEECIPYEIEVSKVLRPPYSKTFHGRDLFAPVVSFLLAEEPLESFSKKISMDTLVKLEFKPPQKTEKGLKLAIWYVDRFGNLITNFSQELLKAKNKPFKILVNHREVPLVKTYGEAKKGDLVALFGSEGLLEIAINQGSAKEVLGEPEIEIIFENEGV